MTMFVTNRNDYLMISQYYEKKIKVILQHEKDKKY
jgi:hypothetical protein